MANKMIKMKKFGFGSGGVGVQLVQFFIFIGVTIN